MTKTWLQSSLNFEPNLILIHARQQYERYTYLISIYIDTMNQEKGKDSSNMLLVNLFPVPSLKSICLKRYWMNSISLKHSMFAYLLYNITCVIVVYGYKKRTLVISCCWYNVNFVNLTLWYNWGNLNFLIEKRSLMAFSQPNSRGM